MKPALKTETNTAAIDAEIRRAARVLLGIPAKDLQSDFEHGQWWVTNKRTGAQWSVVDAEGPSTVNGFDFEQVSLGDDS